jgi:DNA-binding NtrC family response regulator
MFAGAALSYNFNMSKRPIILVDDEEGLRESIEMALNDMGITLKTAKGGAEAIAMLPAIKEPCIFMIDLLMPDGDGWELLSKIRDHGEEHGYNHRVVVMSGASSGAAIAEQEGAGFITKPFGLAQLLDLIERYNAADDV